MPYPEGNPQNRASYVVAQRSKQQPQGGGERRQRPEKQVQAPPVAAEGAADQYQNQAPQRLGKQRYLDEGHGDDAPAVEPA
jgi:hypothetical protein